MIGDVIKWLVVGWIFDVQNFSFNHIGCKDDRLDINFLQRFSSQYIQSQSLLNYNPNDGRDARKLVDFSA